MPLEIITPTTIARRAVIVGINDFGDPAVNLRGCVNDARDWRVLLAQCGYTDIIVLLDRDATRANILEALNAQRAKTQIGDHLGVVMSTHGSQDVDASGDERDGYDEVICCADVMRDWKGGTICDDDIGPWVNGIVRGALPWGAIDACHSETLERNLIARPKPGSDDWNRPRFMAPRTDAKIPTRPGRGLFAGRRRKPGTITIDNTLRALILSGCGASETSADARIGGRYCGAFSHYMIDALHRTWGKPMSERLFLAAEMVKRAGYSQRPRLCAPVALADHPILETI